jgi:class 3 adenylate cyclase/tetratricopeptide (TPR) repeat protein
VTLCANCGHENREGAKFCEECAAPLAVAPSAREQRKTVTVLFCDVTGSTSLGESTDPEALRALLARYFERMKAIVESHGGTVEKFIGDAVMAVFGVPQVHEDDALRACRAAVEMRDALPELGVQARIGVNTGEVVTGTQERLATGDAVNVAARLEQAAQPGEILIGEETLRLVRDTVETRPVEQLEVKGKAEPVEAHKLLTVREPGERSLEAPMVGRQTELRRLRDAFEQAAHGRSCQLFTLLGAAGVGKSRLAYEFLQGLDAPILRGRCLSYGEGITYWPVVEVLKQLGRLPSDSTAAASLRSLLGESEQGTSAEEIAWAFRKLLEEQAQERPLVCVFDDIHWGEETFLDLVEHVADLSREAPILLLCMARPDLLDKRSGWGGGKLNATTVLLEPLSDEEADVLLDAFGHVEPELKARIREAAEGNPLFVEEMLALVRDSGDGEIEVPPTIQALLAARLDQLHPSERSILQCGSVEGRIFHRSAVQALDPQQEAQLPTRLVSLVRKELVRPDKTQLPGDDAFRFRHLLIRDAAYEALPKATRSGLHESFADWLQKRAPDLVELDEIVGYHLEQAAKYKRELGQPDPALAERAGERLAAAGRVALWRGDGRTAAPLLARALDLVGPLRFDGALELDLLAAEQPETAVAIEVAERIAKSARAHGDRSAEIHARSAAAMHRVNLDPETLGAAEAFVSGALEELRDSNDDAALAAVWALEGWVDNMHGRMEGWAQAAEQALVHGRRLSLRWHRPVGLAGSMVNGPRPADEALATLDRFYDPTPVTYLDYRAWLIGMLGRLDEAQTLATEGRAKLRELIGGPSSEEQGFAEVAILAGDYESAASCMREICTRLEEQRLVSLLSTYAPHLGRSLWMLGQDDEAERLAQLGRELGDERDVMTQMLWRQVQALVEARRGNTEEAKRLAQEAVARVEATDMLNNHGKALCDLAEVLVLGGGDAEAAEVLEKALECYERKKNLAMVAQVKPKLEDLRAHVS